MKPRQAMMTAMKAANWASVFEMRPEDEMTATKRSRGRRATRTKITAAASRRLIALDTEPGSFIGGSFYCRIPAGVSPKVSYAGPPVFEGRRRSVMSNPLSRREVLRFGAFTTVGGV